ncbi:MAG: G1 family glutamic endopeptidase [Acidimicrobiales bacterium]|jgi:hypothetical protein
MKVRTLLAAAVATALATMVTSSMASASEPTTTGTPYYLAGVNTGLTSTLNSLYSTFKVPKVTCPSKPTYPPLTIDDELVGYSSTYYTVTVIGLQVSIQCSGSTPYYSSILYAGGVSGESEPISPGDSIQLNLYENNSSNASYVQMTYVSTEQTVTESGPGFSTDVSAQLTVQGGDATTEGSKGPYPMFTTITFKNSTADTNGVSTFLNQWYEADGKGRVMIALGPFNKKGTGFTLTFERDK